MPCMSLTRQRRLACLCVLGGVSCIITPFCCINVDINILFMFCFVLLSLCTRVDAKMLFVCALIWLQLSCVACLFDLFLFVCLCVCLSVHVCSGHGAKEETQERQAQEPREWLLFTRTRPPRLVWQRT